MSPEVVRTVNSPREIKAFIEAALGGLVAHKALEQKVETAREKLEATVLRTMHSCTDALPADWSGVPISEESLNAPSRADFLAAKKQFAIHIGDLLANGIVTVSHSWMSRQLSITFGVYHGAGTGEAAAQLVAATLATHGVESKVSGTKVTFTASPDERRALMAFKDAVNDVLKCRQELLAHLSSK